MRQSRRQRYRQGYDAAASCDLMLTPCLSPICYATEGDIHMKMSGKEAYSLILRGFPDIMNVEEMCNALSISTKTGYKLLKEGKINGMKVGRTYRIPKVHVLEYMKIVDRKPPLSTTALPAAE